MKYAVIGSGGKQYITREGETINVDRLPLEVGSKVEFKEVLLTVDGTKVQVGKPHVNGAAVKGEVTGQIKGPKIIVFKYIPKERYRKKRGHRQHYTQVTIDSISLKAPAKKTAKAEEKPKAAPKKTATAKKTSTDKEGTTKSSTGTKKSTTSTKTTTKKTPTSKSTTSKSTSSSKKTTTTKKDTSEK
jgi:large subunit ribosomal protein L21